MKIPAVFCTNKYRCFASSRVAPSKYLFGSVLLSTITCHSSDDLACARASADLFSWCLSAKPAATDTSSCSSSVPLSHLFPSWSMMSKMCLGKLGLTGTLPIWYRIFLTISDRISSYLHARQIASCQYFVGPKQSPIPTHFARVARHDFV